MGMRRIALTVLLLAGTLTGCVSFESSCSSGGDWPYYETVDELYAAATLVFEGEVGDGENEIEQGIAHRRHDVTVSRVWKGQAVIGDLVPVKMMRHDGRPQLDEGRRYLLFVETYPDSPASTLNPEQGHYPLDDAGRPVSLSCNELTVTADDLNRLRATG
jgi:hypothetical protein